MALFSSLPLLPEDPILGLQEAFLKDTHPDKLNFTIGTLTGTSGKVRCFQSIQRAREHLLLRPPQFGYAPLGGEKAVHKALHTFLFGESEQEPPLFYQTVGGTGALFHIFSLLKIAGFNTVYATSPMWPNYPTIAKSLDLPFKTLPHTTKEGYFNRKGLEAVFSTLSQKEAVLLQFSCHNPTGIDPSYEEWECLFDMIQERGITLILDMAYLGFCEAPEKECALLRLLEKKNMAYFLAISFAKSMGLYGERVGFVCRSSSIQGELALIESHLKHISRATYSSTPRFGALLLLEVLKSKDLTKEWLHELQEVRSSFQKIRRELSEALEGFLCEGALRSLKEGKGLFSLLDFSKEEVLRLRSLGVWCTDTGRINIGSITKENSFSFIGALRKVRG